MKAKLVDRKEEGRNVRLTFESYLTDVGKIPDGDLDLVIKKWRSPRSREALNYSWQIITEIAEKMSVRSTSGWLMTTASWKGMRAIS